MLSNDQFRGLIRMVRLRACGLGLVFAALGIYLSGHIELIGSIHILQGLLVVPLCIAFGFVINDYADASLDQIAKPDRPIPAGRVTRRQALVFALALAASTLILGWTLETLFGLFVTLSLLLSAAYSYSLKQTLFIGNAAVALLNCSIVLYGSLLAGSVTLPVVLVTVMAFLYSFAYEVLYAVEDHEGDVQGGVHTTAARLGRARSLLLVRVISLISIAGVFIPWIVQLASPAYLIFAIVLFVLPTLWVVQRLTMQSDLDAVKAARRVMTLVFYISLIPVFVLYLNL